MREKANPSYDGKPENRRVRQPTKRCYDGSMTCSPLI